MLGYDDYAQRFCNWSAGFIKLQTKKSINYWTKLEASLDTYILE
jgi:hypothetical protein